MRTAIALVVLALASGVQAQTQQCVCTSGCKIASDPFPAPPIAQPASCTVYRMPGHTQIGSGAVVLATSIATSNSAVCLPADGPYSPGPQAGQLACLVSIPGQPAGSNVTFVMTATNAQVETADSAVRTFQSVQTLPTVPPVPLNPRVTP